MKRYIAILLCIVMAFGMAACGKAETNESSASSDAAQSDTANSETTEATAENQTPSKDEDDDVDTYITLNDTTAEIDGKGAAFENGVISITAAGVYSIKGKLSDGYIFVNTDDDKKVKLMLNGVEIYSSVTAPIFVENSSKETKIVLMNGTENKLSDNAQRTTDEQNELYANAVIYSKDDLELCGSGSLTIEANFAKGVFSKNDLQFSGGTINVTAVDDAIRGKDSVSVSGGVLNLTCGGDGIRTNNSEEDGKGGIAISGGTVNVTSDGDGIQATTTLDISGGSVTVKAGGGSTEDIRSSSPQGRFGGYNGFGNNSAQSSSSDDTSSTSTKALKATGSISISGGTINLDSYDDAVHSNSGVTVSSGTLNISTNDDGIHSDDALAVTGGLLNIKQSYEGLEGKTISISGGESVVNATDDGLNSASSEDQSENPYSFGGRGGDGGSTDTSASISITGGKLFVNASGDGIDSNGSINMTDGYVIVFGPTSGGDTAFDYQSSSNVTGGTLLAVGSSGMAEGIGNSSPYIFSNTSIAADTLVTITDSSGNDLIAFVTPKQIENIIFYTKGMNEGDNYTIQTGGSNNGSLVNGVYTDGSTTGATTAATAQASASNGKTGMGGGMGGFGGQGGFDGGQGGFGGGRPGNQQPGSDSSDDNDDDFDI